jgi:hypothetical protein
VAVVAQDFLAAQAQVVLMYLEKETSAVQEEQVILVVAVVALARQE